MIHETPMQFQKATAIDMQSHYVFNILGGGAGKDRYGGAGKWSWEVECR